MCGVCDVSAGLEEKWRSSEAARTAANTQHTHTTRALEAAEQQTHTLQCRVVELAQTLSAETGASAKRVSELESALALSGSRSAEWEQVSGELRKQYAALSAELQTLTQHLNAEKQARLALEKDRIQVCRSVGRSVCRSVGLSVCWRSIYMWQITQ